MLIFSPITWKRSAKHAFTKNHSLILEIKFSAIDTDFSKIFFYKYYLINSANCPKKIVLKQPG